MAGLPAAGLQTAVCDVNSIHFKKLGIYYKLLRLLKCLQEFYQVSDLTNLTLEEWVDLQEDSMFEYWYGVLKIEIETMIIVRGFREISIMLLLWTLKKVLELRFALDHNNYVRWLSVFVQDLEVAYGDNPELFSQLSSHLSVTTTNAKFSRIAYDHKHENNNKCIKSTSGCINLLNKEDKSYLRKLEICLPEILPYMESCEGKVMKNHKHEKEMPSFSISYLTDVKRALILCFLIREIDLSHQFCT